MKRTRAAVSVRRHLSRGAAALVAVSAVSLVALGGHVGAPPDHDGMPAATTLQPAEAGGPAIPGIPPVSITRLDTTAPRERGPDQPLVSGGTDIGAGPPGSGLTTAVPPPTSPGGAAALALIDFEDLGVAPNSQLNPPADQCVNTGGYDYCPGPNNASGFNDLHISNQQAFFSWNGTTVGGTHDDVVLSRPDGQPFTVTLFDFAGFPMNGEIGFTLTVQPSGTVYNYTPDGIVDGDPDGTGGQPDFQTFAVPAGTVGTSFTWEHTGAGTEQGIFALDNIEVGPAGPPNDRCEDAIVVFNGETPYDMNGAQADETPTCFGVFPDIFFRYIADFTGPVTFSICGDSDFHGIEVYEGCNCPLLANTFLDCATCNVSDPACFGDCRSEVTVNVTSGQCYTIWVAQNVGVGAGVLTITKSFTPPPACEPLIYDNGDADLFNGVRPTVGWTDNGIIDDMTLPQLGGTEFSCFTADFYTTLGDGNLETMRLRIYDLPSSGISGLGDFNLEVPIYDATVSVAAGTLQHVDTGVDQFGLDLVRLIADVPPANIGNGHFGVHLMFPGTGATGFWATSPVTPTDCSHVWGPTTTTAEAICPGLGEGYRNLAFKFGNPQPNFCPWDCGDGNGTVDIVDLLALLSQWNGPGGCDVNGNGIVNIVDLLALLANWGPCPACPAPGSCFEPHNNPGCDDAECCEIVCMIDPFCCNNTWDGICANEAIQLCQGVPCDDPARCQFSNLNTAIVSNGPQSYADNFVPVSDATSIISGACWWGVYFDPVLQDNCGPGPDDFTINYYVDNGAGLPGPLIATFSQSGGTLFVDPPVPTGNIIFGVANEYQHTATHPPISIPPGQCTWIEIINTGPVPPCRWQWDTSSAGDGHGAVRSTGNPFSPAGFDTAFCLTIDIYGAPPCPTMSEALGGKALPPPPAIGRAD